MDIIERNKNLMKDFELMINTADEGLAQKLIADEASFITSILHSPLYSLLLS